MLKEVSLSEIKSGNYIIQKITRNDYYRQNSYIILDLIGHYQIIIDPGDNPEFIEELIQKNNCELTAILFTHGHFDHIGAAHYLSEKYGVFCYIHESDLKLVKQSPNYALLFEKKTIKAPLKIKSFSDFFLKAPQVIHTPGHTEGSSCFMLENNIFTGDTLMLNETGRTDLPGGSLEKLKDSLAKLYSLCNKTTIIYPGHGNCFNFIDFEKPNS